MTESGIDSKEWCIRSITGERVQPVDSPDCMVVTHLQAHADLTKGGLHVRHTSPADDDPFGSDPLFDLERP
jgi:hypothetical protein